MDIRFASPAAGATFVSPGPITLKAGVSGSIKRVRFFANNVQIGSDDATAPFSREWKGMLSGLFELRAIGFDQKGRKVGEATSIVITVRAAAPGPDPVPVPVDCVLSPWSDWSAWAPIDATSERRTRTRTVVTAPANGGAACAQTLETETRLIVVVVPPPVDPPPVVVPPPDPSGISPNGTEGLTVTDLGLHVWTLVDGLVAYDGVPVIGMRMDGFLFWNGVVYGRSGAPAVYYQLSADNGVVTGSGWMVDPRGPQPGPPPPPPGPVDPNAPPPEPYVVVYPPPPDANTVTAPMLKWLGRFLAPWDGVGDMNYGDGFTVKPDPVDPTKVTFLAGAYTPPEYGGAGLCGNVFEFGEVPATPEAVNRAPVLRQWGNVFGNKRMCGDPPYYNFSDNAGTLKQAHLYYDPVDRVVMGLYGETYEQGNHYWLVYAKLNEATGTSEPFGPFRLTATQYKGCLAGLVDVPAEFRSAGNLGAQRLAAIGSSPASVVGSGGHSCGPSATAFVSPVGKTEVTDLPSTRLVGYQPTQDKPMAGVDRATRPLGMEWIPSPTNPMDGWPGTKWNYIDTTYGAVWPHGVKSGLITLNRLGIGMVNYVSAALYQEMSTLTVSIYGEADLLAVAKGEKQPHELQPNTSILSFPGVVFSPSTDIAEIDTVVGDAQASWSDGCIVTTKTPHGLPSHPGAYGYIYLKGTSRPAEFGQIWEYSVIDATHIRCRDGNHPDWYWSGIPAVGGTLRSVGHGDGVKIHGITRNPSTGLIYIMYSYPAIPGGRSGWAEVAVFQLNTTQATT